MTNHEMIKQAYSKLPEPDAFKGFSIRIPIMPVQHQDMQFIVVFHKGLGVGDSDGAFWCFSQIEKLNF